MLSLNCYTGSCRGYCYIHSNIERLAMNILQARIMTRINTYLYNECLELRQRIHQKRIHSKLHVLLMKKNNK